MGSRLSFPRFLPFDGLRSTHYTAHRATNGLLPFLDPSTYERTCVCVCVCAYTRVCVCVCVCTALLTGGGEQCEEEEEEDGREP